MKFFRPLVFVLFATLLIAPAFAATKHVLPASVTIDNGVTLRTWEGVMGYIDQLSGSDPNPSIFGFMAVGAPSVGTSNGAVVGTGEPKWEGYVQDNDGAPTLFFAGCALSQFAYMDEGGMHLWLRCPPPPSLTTDRKR